MGPIRAHHIPNMLTVLRVILILPIAWCIIAEQYRAALILVFIAGVSDGLDGLLARRFAATSHFGGAMDPLADKLLLVTTFIILTLKGFIQPWLLGIVILRDVVVVIGATSFHYLIAYYEFAPSLISKFNTFLQILLVLLILVQQGLWAVVPELIWGLKIAVLLTTVSSMIDYVWTWGRRAILMRRQQRGK